MKMLTFRSILNGERSISETDRQITRMKIPPSKSFRSRFGRLVITEHSDISSRNDLSDLRTVVSNLLEHFGGELFAFGNHLDDSNVVRSEESRICRVDPRQRLSTARMTVMKRLPTRITMRCEEGRTYPAEP